MLIKKFPKVHEFAFLPDSALDSYRILSGSIQLTQYEIRKLINKAYITTASEEGNSNIIYKSGNVVVNNIESANRIYLITKDAAITDGSAIVLIFVPNRNPDRQPWELQNAITENEFNSVIYVEIGNLPSKMLFNYAYWPSFLADLIMLKNDYALHENWSFKEIPEEDDLPILKSYIIYTFAKAWRDKRVLLSVDGRFSVFNTGLVNRNYQYIYILFEKNIGMKPWKFSMFCIPGIRHGGRLLADNFSVLPKPVRYFTDISDISYIIAEDKTPDEQLPDLQPDHYFIDHPERLPHYFLVDGCRKSPKLLDLLSIDISKFHSDQKKEYWKKVSNVISSDSDVYDDLESSFRSAVRKAIMRVSWNYRTAIPVYFPSHNKMSVLLPLSFSTKTEAEAALVVEYNDVSKKYTAPTILPLTIAYSNARLVCKPESDWLNQRTFEPVLDHGPKLSEEEDFGEVVWEAG